MANEKPRNERINWALAVAAVLLAFGFIIQSYRLMGVSDSTEDYDTLCTAVFQEMAEQSPNGFVCVFDKELIKNRSKEDILINGRNESRWSG